MTAWEGGRDTGRREISVSNAVVLAYARRMSNEAAWGGSSWARGADITSSAKDSSISIWGGVGCGGASSIWRSVGAHVTCRWDIGDP